MCGICGILVPQGSSDLISDLILALKAIQHRGYDGSGLVLEDFSCYKSPGMINHLEADLLKSQPDCLKMAIAHTRYKTKGKLIEKSIQPLTNQKNLALVHNGQINYPKTIHPDDSDSQIILNQIQINIEADQQELLDSIGLRTNGKFKLFYLQEKLKEKVFSTIFDLNQKLSGSYSCLLMVKGLGLVAFRDPRGIRPLVIGKTAQKTYLISSESVSHQRLENFLPSRFKFESIWDVKPGEVIIISDHARFEARQYRPSQKFFLSPDFSPCVFEYIYLAHPDSVLNGLSVRKARARLGYLLSQKIKSQALQPDLIIPVPESSLLASDELSRQLEIPIFKLIKLNHQRELPRSFILPTQELRERAVSNKFIITPDLASELNQKHLLIVDDSIVRGTTLKYLVGQIRKLYPKVGSISLASVAPQIKQANYFGIDIPDTSLLVGHQRTEEQIAKILGADRVIYQDLSLMLEQLSPKIKSFEHSVFLD